MIGIGVRVWEWLGRGCSPSLENFESTNIQVARIFVSHCRKRFEKKNQNYSLQFMYDLVGIMFGLCNKSLQCSYIFKSG